MTRRHSAGRGWAVVAVVGSLLAAGTVAAAPTAGAAEARVVKPICDRFAGVGGRDGAPGTRSRPYRSVARLVGAIRPGRVGCLLGGTFVENVSIERGGRRRDRVVLRSAPGTRALIKGYVVIRDTANFVTLAHLDVNGSDVTPITVHVYGDDAVLDSLEITNWRKTAPGYTGSCILLGRYRLPAVRPVVQHSRIHDCGATTHDHGIYAEFPRRAVIRDNYIYDSPGYGISMYPDAQRTLVLRNVIDGNGHGNVTFSGERAGAEYSQNYASSNNVLSRNVIANARSRYNVESFFPSLRPVGNSVTVNCVWNAPWGNFGYTSGYSRVGNIDADPQYVDARAKDFRLRRGTPCGGMGPRRPPVVPPARRTSVDRR